MKTFFFALFLSSLTFFQFEQLQSQPTTAPKVIARFDKATNAFILNDTILVKKFADGSKIERFSIQKGENGFFLVRQGIDSKKQYRSEAFRLQTVEKNGLFLVLDFKVKWYTVCSSLSCWCHKIGNSCECADGGECFFGRVPIDDDIEIIVIA